MTSFVRVLAAIVAVAGLGVPVLAQPTPTPPTPPPGADLAVVGVQVIGAAPRWVEEEPTDTFVRLTVENRGAAPASPYRINYHWMAAGGSSWLNGEEAHSFDVHEGSLASGGRVTHEAPWRLQPSHRGPGGVRASLEGAADARADNDAATLPVFVPVHNLTLAIAGGPQPIHAEETRFHRVTVHNHGNQDEPVALSLVNASVGDAARLTESLEASTLVAPPGGSASTLLYATYPFAGDTRPFQVAYEIVAATAYGRTLRSVAPPFEGRHDPMPPPSPHRLDRLTVGELVADPGDEIIVRFALTSVGEESDVYVIDAVGDAGWDVSLTRDRAGLDPGERIEFEARVPFPADALLGSEASARLEVRSTRAFEADVHDFALRVHGPRVRLEPPAGWPPVPYLGDPVRVPVVVFNDGDEATPDGSVVEVEAIGLGDEVLVNSTTLGPVPPGGSVAVELGFGVYEAPGPVRFDASWSAAGAAIESAGYSVESFVHDAHLVVEAPAPLFGVPGETVSYRNPPDVFVVTNLGNGPEPIMLAAQAEHGRAEVALPEAVIVLGAGESRSVPINHTLPRPSGGLERANASFVASIAGRGDLTWNATVRTAMFDGQPPTVALTPLPNIWSLGEPLPLHVSAEDDVRVAGVRVEHTAPSGARHTVTLSRDGVSGSWNATLVPAEVGNHSLVASARDAAGKEASTHPVRVNVRAIPPPRLSLQGPNESADVLASERFFVMVADELPIESVIVRFLGVQNNIFLQRPLTLDDSGRAEFNLSGLPGGRVGIRVEAINAAGARSLATRTVALLVPTETAAPLEETSALGPNSSVAAPVPAAAFAGLAALLAARWSRRRPPTATASHFASSKLNGGSG